MTFENVAGARPAARAREALPRVIRQTINLRAHAESLAHAVTRRQELVAEARAMLDAGQPFATVLQALSGASR